VPPGLAPLSGRGNNNHNNNSSKETQNAQKDAEGRRKKTTGFVLFCVLLRFLRVLRLLAVKASR